MIGQTPKKGDKYTSLFQSDLDEEVSGVEPLEIEQVNYLCDDGVTWCITASDGIDYDATWSERHQIWCYNLG